MVWFSWSVFGPCKQNGRRRLGLVGLSAAAAGQTAARGTAFVHGHSTLACHRCHRQPPLNRCSCLHCCRCPCGCPPRTGSQQHPFARRKPAFYTPLLQNAHRGTRNRNPRQQHRTRSSTEHAAAERTQHVSKAAVRLHILLLVVLVRVRGDAHVLALKQAAGRKQQLGEQAAAGKKA